MALRPNSNVRSSFAFRRSTSVNSASVLGALDADGLPALHRAVVMSAAPSEIEFNINTLGVDVNLQDSENRTVHRAECRTINSLSARLPHRPCITRVRPCRSSS